jgi:hypothetical protein
MRFFTKHLFLIFTIIGLISCSESKISSTSINELTKSVFDITSEMSDEERKIFIENISIISNSLSKNIAGIPDINTLNFLNNKNISEIALESKNILLSSQKPLDLLKEKINKINSKKEELKQVESRELENLEREKNILKSTLRLNIDMIEEKKNIENNILKFKLKDKSLNDKLVSLKSFKNKIVNRSNKTLIKIRKNEKTKKTKEYQEIKRLMVFFDAIGYEIFKGGLKNKIQPSDIDFSLKNTKTEYSNLFISFSLINHSELPIKYNGASVTLLEKLKKIAAGLEKGHYSYECPKELVIEPLSTLKIKCKYNGSIYQASKYGFEKEKEVTIIPSLSILNSDLRIYKKKCNVAINRYMLPKPYINMSDNSQLIECARNTNKKLGNLTLKKELNGLNKEQNKIDAGIREVNENLSTQKNINKPKIELLTKQLDEIAQNMINNNINQAEEGSKLEDKSRDIYLLNDEIVKLIKSLSVESKKYDLAIKKHQSLKNVILGM